LPAQHAFLAASAARRRTWAASDIAIEAKEIVLVRERLNRQIAAATGQPYESVTKDTDRNFWMPAEKAKEYGMVSRIISSAAELG
jgi:ATP-dependent Clp protease protease subunit